MPSNKVPDNCPECGADGNQFRSCQEPILLVTLNRALGNCSQTICGSCGWHAGDCPQFQDCTPKEVAEG